VYDVLIEYLSKFESYKNLRFNIIKLENLRDKNSFVDLVRGMLIVKEVDNVREI